VNTLTPPPSTTAPERMLQLWQQHTHAEFVDRNADAAVALMTERAYVLHVASGTGGTGREQVRRFYAHEFLPFIPQDFQLVPVSQMFAADRIIEELVARFTHTLQMDWVLPGVPPTGRRVDFAMIAVIGFEHGKIASEHIYWDQATVLWQLGVVDLPVAAHGAGSATRLLELSRRPNGEPA
jgi:carboxymethylenebutenolidase